MIRTVGVHGPVMAVFILAAFVLPMASAAVAPFEVPPYHSHGEFAGPTPWPLPILDIASNSPRPPMGWSSWNAFGDNPGPSAQLACEVADALVETGLRDCGYVTLLAFDGEWANVSTNPNRDAKGRIIPDPRRWPHGVQVICDYIHGKGLRVGGYTDIGKEGFCYPAQTGSFQREQQDADQFAAWGWDYIKVDCRGPGNYWTICRALFGNASKRPIIISLSTPQVFPADFGPRIANMWRTGGDITGNLGHGAWQDVCREFDLAEQLWWAQAPGRWNDLDMLVVGLYGISDEEAKSHLGMWAIRGAPLILGCDIRPPFMGSSGPIPKISVEQLEMLKNREVIAVDQDPLGAAGRKVGRSGPGEVYAKPLGSFASGEMAVLFLNRGETPIDIPLQWSDLGLVPGPMTVRDLWAHSDLKADAAGTVAKAVPRHGTVMLRVKGAFDWSRPREYEAESSYNTFTGLAHQVCKQASFSGTAGVAGIGNGPGNTLRFNRVAAPTTGTYKMNLFYAAAEDSAMDIAVNGDAPIFARLPATGGGDRIKCTSLNIRLNAGEANTVLCSRLQGWAPILDRMAIEPRE